ncbi:MAG: hypothetical protein ACRDNZ_09625 [Streptosporangiaceae bacterium]
MSRPRVVIAAVVLAAASAILGWVSARVLAGQEAPPSRISLPSVSVSNSSEFGRVAALAWWTQDLPKEAPG